MAAAESGSPYRRSRPFTATTVVGSELWFAAQSNQRPAVDQGEQKHPQSLTAKGASCFQILAKLAGSNRLLVWVMEILEIPIVDEFGAGALSDRN
jgi:hypothetical protein